MRTALSGNGSDDDAVDAAATGSGSNVGEIGGEVDDGSSDGCCFSVSDDDVGCLRVELRVMTVPLLEDCFCIQPDLSTRCQECQEVGAVTVVVYVPNSGLSLRRLCLAYARG